MKLAFQLLLLFVLSFQVQAEVSDYPVVFVHGIANRFEDWRPMAEQISNQPVYSAGFARSGLIETDAPDTISTPGSIWLLSYYRPNPVKETITGDLTLYSQRLAQLIALVKQKTGSEKVVIVAHSMGGLVSRFYMSHELAHWQSVYRILTVGTPHRGVYLSPPILGQLQDLASNSDFISQLDKQWVSFPEANKKWGVIGAVSFLNGPLPVNGLSSDFAGPGYVSLYSSIPFGEWELALKQPEKADLNTEHFGYRLLLHSGHRELLKHSAVKTAINWAREVN